MKFINCNKILLSSVLGLSLLLAACTDESTEKNVTNESTNQQETITKETPITENKPSVTEEKTVHQTEKEVTTQPSGKFGNSKDISYEVGFENATMVKITDGDTMTVKTESGEELKLRLLLIDTPETVHPSKPVQPFGPEASAFAKEFFPIGSTVQVEYDVSGKSLDKYGRTLAYVWKDGKMYNEEVIARGLARVAYIYAPNTRHVDLLKEVQAKAQKEKLGIWSIEDYVSDSGFEGSVDGDTKQSTPSTNTNKTTSNTSSSSNGTCNIKGNQGSEWIYHVPGGAFYEKTQAEEYFCTTEEAEAAGYRAAKR